MPRQGGGEPDTAPGSAPGSAPDPEGEQDGPGEAGAQPDDDAEADATSADEGQADDQPEADEDQADEDRADDGEAGEGEGEDGDDPSVRPDATREGGEAEAAKGPEGRLPGEEEPSGAPDDPTEPPTTEEAPGAPEAAESAGSEGAEAAGDAPDAENADRPNKPDNADKTRKPGKTGKADGVDKASAAADHPDAARQAAEKDPGDTAGEDADPAAGDRSGAAEKTPPGEAAERGPVDQPTAMLRAPKSATPTRPVADPPTTALRVGRPPSAGGGSASVPPPPAAPPKPAASPAPPPPPKPKAPPPPADSERDPLELLAALTNRSAPPPTPWRTALRRVKIYTPLVLLLLLVLAGVQALRPLPDPDLELTVSETYTFEGAEPSVPWPDTGQAAMIVDGVGSFGSSGGDDPVPIASLAKVMTAYVILRDHPLESGSRGPDIEIDQRAEEDAGLSAEGESTVQTRAGDTISQYEALQAILIASANNVARLLARWDAGSEEAFVEKMNEAADELGMADTTYTDPSGLRAETVSTATDQVELARAAMADPVFREIVSVSSYFDQYGDEQRNWNFLVPEDGVVGIKTGTTDASAGCLMFAARQTVDGESQLILGTVLGQPAAAEDNSILTGALNAGEELMDFAQDELVAADVFSKGQQVGHVDDGLGGETPVTVTRDVRAVGWPGLEVSVRLVEDGGDNGEGVPGAAEAGTRVGSLSIGDGSGGEATPVELAADLEKPGFSARLSRLG